MGNTQTHSQLHDQPASTLVLDIDINKQIEPNLKQLLNWSLSEIRQIYSFFRKRKNTPILNRTQFSRLIGLSRTTSFYLFPFLAPKGQQLTVFEVISILVITSYTNLADKIHFLFLVFDLVGKKSLRLTETILMYRSAVAGFCKLTNQKCPDSYLIEKYAKAIFTKSDLNQDQGLEIEQVADSFQSNMSAVQLLNRFEPKEKINQQYHIFNTFLPYTSDQRHQIQRILFSTEKENIYGTLKSRSKPNLLATMQTLPKLKNMQHSPSTLSELRIRDLAQTTASKFSGMRVHKTSNVLIIKGASVTKHQIYQLKDYFDKLSNGSAIISMQQFLEAFSGEKFDHMRSVTASLFNFLDRKQTGKISFIDLLFKLYPNLSYQQLEIIKGWIRQYEKMYNADNKTKTDKKEEIKIKTLPSSCMIRVKQIFNLFDKEKKGWISLDNLKKSFNDVFTEKEIVQMFQRRDTDHDGKLQIEDFIRILLPPDIEIQGCKIKS